MNELLELFHQPQIPASPVLASFLSIVFQFLYSLGSFAQDFLIFRARGEKVCFRPKPRDVWIGLKGTILIARTQILRLLGTAILGLAGLLVIASNAEAGEFRVNGGTFTAKGISSATFASETGLIQFLVPDTGLTIHCTGSDSSGSILKGGQKHYLNLYSGCTVLGNGNCKIYPEEEEGGALGHWHEEGLGSVVLHGLKKYLLQALIAGAIYFLGNKCTLPEENIITGSTAEELPSAASELVEQPIQDISSTTESLLGVALFFGGYAASIDGSEAGSMYLTGAHTGQTWGAE